MTNPKATKAAIKKKERQAAIIARLQRGRIDRNQAKIEQSSKPVMLFLAEKVATKRDITTRLEIEAQRWLEKTTFSPSQPQLVKHLHQWLKQFDFAGFSRKKTVEQVAAREWRRRRGW